MKNLLSLQLEKFSLKNQQRKFIFHEVPGRSNEKNPCACFCEERKELARKIYSDTDHFVRQMQANAQNNKITVKKEIAKDGMEEFLIVTPMDGYKFQAQNSPHLPGQNSSKRKCIIKNNVILFQYLVFTLLKLFRKNV